MGLPAVTLLEEEGWREDERIVEEHFGGGRGMGAT